jgi:YD repeat-containing protein
LRHTHTDYLATANYTDAVTGAHLRSLPTASRVYAVNPANNVETLAAQSTMAYDELSILPYGSVTGWTDPGTPARGNVTSAGKWLDTTGAYIQTRVQYDQCGNVRKTWDARDTGLTNPTQISYSDAFSDGVPRNTYAFPTNVTTAVSDPGGIYGSNVALTTTSVYDLNTGKVVSGIDSNAKTTSYDYSDPLDRLKQVTLPDGGRTIYTYVDAHQCGPYAESRTLLDSTGREAVSYQFFDGLGRPKRAFTHENQDTNNPSLTIDTQYDSMGRVWRVSSPYRSSGCTATINPLGRWTTTGFDALSRVVSVTTPDSAVVSTAYSGNNVTVTDQAGKTRRSVTDALGCLARVDEPDSNGNLGLTSAPAQPTSYTYDVLGNLRRVDQGSQQRFFMYDSLSRLIRAKNPEQLAGSVASNLTDPITGNTQWSLAYGYDNNGNLTARVDARNVTTTYAYDALNRNTTVRYTDGTKDIDRHYDNPTANKNGLGRFWYSNWDQNNNTRFDSHLAIDQYDALGRPSNYRQHFLTNGVASPQFNVTRSYDKAGHVLTQSYPSGRSVTYGYDIAGRLNSDTGNIGDGVTRSYAASISYSEFGGMQQEQFGTQTALYHKLHYNVRGQLYDVRLALAAGE